MAPSREPRDHTMRGVQMLSGMPTRVELGSHWRDRRSWAPVERVNDREDRWMAMEYACWGCHGAWDGRKHRSMRSQRVQWLPLTEMAPTGWSRSVSTGVAL
ncbi:hypothetical protein FRAHR75_420017 [Frankia sp. Hr75.2]|nr:hypothetical protein FRAHR75_420017 [Frankia sp. Hr75.2]